MCDVERAGKRAIVSLPAEKGRIGFYGPQQSPDRAKVNLTLLVAYAETAHQDASTRSLITAHGIVLGCVLRLVKNEPARSLSPAPGHEPIRRHEAGPTARSRNNRYRDKVHAAARALKGTTILHALTSLSTRPRIKCLLIFFRQTHRGDFNMRQLRVSTIGELFNSYCQSTSRPFSAPQLHPEHSWHYCPCPPHRSKSSLLSNGPSWSTTLSFCSGRQEPLRDFYLHRLVQRSRQICARMDVLRSS